MCTTRNQPEKGISCYRCKQSMFAVTETSDIEKYCPICDNLVCEDIGWSYEEFETDKEIYFKNYCKYCKIIFGIGCVHASNGCSDDIFNAELVNKFEINGQKYTGMPIFNSSDEFIDAYRNKNLKLNFVCTCKGFSYDCPKAGYHKGENIKCNNSYYV